MQKFTTFPKSTNQSLGSNSPYILTIINQSIMLFLFIANLLVQCSSRILAVTLVTLVTSICLASARDEGCCGGSKGTRTPAPSFDLPSGNSTYRLKMEYGMLMEYEWDIHGISIYIYKYSYPYIYIYISIAIL